MQEINNAKQESQLAELAVTDEQYICCPKCLSADVTDIAKGYPGKFWKCNDCETVLQVHTIVKEVKICPK